MRSILQRTPAPRAPQESPFVFGPQDRENLQNTMLRFYNLLSPEERASLQRNTTVVIALVSQGNWPTLVYTVASNSTTAGIRAAADHLGLTRWDPEGVPHLAGERHAEQLALEAASKLRFKVHGMAVTREPCADCGPRLAGRRIPVQWVPDPNPPAPRPPSAPGGPPAGGVPPSPPPGQPPASAKAPTQAAGTTKVTAEVGTPLKPVVEATPGFNPGKGAGIGGAAQLLQTRMFGNLQKAEIAKYETRLAELQPKIDGYLGSGNSVELTLIVEKPKRPDLLCGAKVFCEQGQLVYFHDLYISYVESVTPVVTIPRYSTQPGMYPRNGRAGLVPYAHQGGSIIQEREIRHLSARDENHHCEYRKLTLHPREPISPLAANRRPAPPVTPKPRLDPETRRALALAPSRVYLLTTNIVQYKTAVEVRKKLAGNALFGMVTEYMGGGWHRSRTLVSYYSDLDKPRAEALAEIVRSQGVPSAYAELSGDGGDAPGALQISFGTDAER